MKTHHNNDIKIDKYDIKPLQRRGFDSLEQIGTNKTY